MAIKDYSTTAGSNTSVAGINIAEGCPAANVNNGMRAMMADTRSFYEGATWTDLGHTPTRTGNTTFTINSDVTAYYISGRRIRCTDSSTLYGTIASSSYSAPNTTVTVTLDSGNLSASLTAVAVSVIDPTGDPIGTAAINGLSDETADNLFRVVGSSDSTKKLAFEVDGLTTATTRTLTVQDKSGTLPVIETANVLIPGTSAGPASISLAEDTDNGTNTATIIAPASIASNLTHTLPNRSGTLAIGGRTLETLTSGTSWSVPAGVEQVYARGWGGGGGGGGVGGANTLGAGGGGAGGYFEGFLTVTPGGTVAYTIGAAGTAGTSGGGNGGAGGQTTFSTFTANGGSGGTGTASFGSSAGGAGGTASGATVNISGGAGQAGAGASGTGIWGGGGGLPAGGLGIPGKFRPTNTEGQGVGFDAVGYGAGGGGANSSGSSFAGGAGAAGVIILEY